MTKKGLQLEPITSWMKVDRPVIISGPCSAETEDQAALGRREV